MSNKFRNCVVKNCDIINLNKVDRKFHIFPKNEIRKNKWLQILKLEAVNYKSRVCDEHFSTNCFTLSRLSSEAIPSQSLELHLPSVDIIDVQPFESYDFQEESLGKYIISKITVLKYIV
jgi:hypothetical protein